MEGKQLSSVMAGVALSLPGKEDALATNSYPMTTAYAMPATSKSDPTRIIRVSNPLTPRPPCCDIPTPGTDPKFHTARPAVSAAGDAGDRGGTRRCGGFSHSVAARAWRPAAALVFAFAALLATSMSALAASEAVAPDALTASFEGVPASHGGPGAEAFTFRVRFSLEPRVSFRVLRDESFAVTGGDVDKARRVDGRNDLREIHIEPKGWDDVTVMLPGGRACGTDGAICTVDGKVLANTAVATVPGPLALSVADARIDEAPNAVLAFQVTLNRAATGTVTVDYTTADGTATAGADYTAASGTLSFDPGETEKTVNVPVLDDAHDDDEETLTLTLTPEGADGEADPAITTDTSMWMAAAGARGVLVAAADTGGFELAASGDAQIVSMRSGEASGDGGGRLAASEAQTSRVRLMLEGSQRIELAGGQTLTPSLEVGVRHDGGDAETGAGIEIGGGIAWSDPKLGVSADLRASSTLSAFTDAALASAERNRVNSNNASPVRFTPNRNPGSGICREELLTFSPRVASLLSSIQTTS